MASSWTSDTLKEYVDRRFEEIDKSIHLALERQKETKAHALAIIGVVVTVGIPTVAGLSTLIFYLVTRP